MAGRRTLALALVLGLLCMHAARPAKAQEGATPAAAEHDHEHEHDHDHEVAAEQAQLAVEEEGHEHAHEDEDEHAHAAEGDSEGHEHSHDEEDHDEEHHDDEHAHGAEAAGHDHDHGHGGHGHGHDGHAHGVTMLEFAAVAAELGSVEAARADVCSRAALEDYNLGLHIGSIFILLGVSAVGALLPVGLHVSSKSTTIMMVVKMGTYFGFGTILATAFIHMMLPAAMYLSSPCLSDSWNDAYEAWAYLFVVISIVFMQLVDYLVEGAYHKYMERRGGKAYLEQVREADKHAPTAVAASPVSGALVSLHSSEPPHEAQLGAATKHGSADVEAGHGESSESGEEGGTCHVHGDGCTTLVRHQHDPSQIVGIYLLEVGIIFHSVLIGITLGVTSGSAFKTLLVAITLHQFFEGFAIGSAAVDSGMGALRSAMLGLVYTVTTPIGIAVGIGIRESFNQNSTTTLMVEGIFDSISTGILIYVVLVELINPLFTQSAWLRTRRWQLQVLAFLAFWSGVTVMAVIGKWA